MKEFVEQQDDPEWRKRVIDEWLNYDLEDTIQRFGEDWEKDEDLKMELGFYQKYPPLEKILIPLESAKLQAEFYSKEYEYDFPLDTKLSYIDNPQIYIIPEKGQGQELFSQLEQAMESGEVFGKPLEGKRKVSDGGIPGIVFSGHGDFLTLYHLKMDKDQKGNLLDFRQVLAGDHPIDVQLPQKEEAFVVFPEVGREGKDSYRWEPRRALIKYLMEHDISFILTDKGQDAVYAYHIMQRDG